MKNTIVSPRVGAEAKKRIAAMALAAAVAASAAGCGGGDDANAEPPVAPGPTPEVPVTPGEPTLPPPPLASLHVVEAPVGRAGLEIADIASVIGAKPGSVYILTATQDNVARCLMRGSDLVLTPEVETEATEVCTTGGVSVNPEGSPLTTRIEYNVDTLAPRFDIPSWNITRNANTANSAVFDLHHVTDKNPVTLSIPTLPSGYSWNAETNTLSWTQDARADALELVATDSVGNPRGLPVVITDISAPVEPAPEVLPTMTFNVRQIASHTNTSQSNFRQTVATYTCSLSDATPCVITLEGPDAAEFDVYNNLIIFKATPTRGDKVVSVVARSRDGKVTNSHKLSVYVENYVAPVDPTPPAPTCPPGTVYTPGYGCV